MGRLIFFIPSWFIYLLFIKLPVALLGYVMTLITYRYRDTDYKDTPKLLRFWINPEDWQGGLVAYGEHSLPWWWIKPATARNPYYRGRGTGFKSFYAYHTRNSGNGLRATWLGGVRLDPERVHYSTPHYMKEYTPAALRDSGRKMSVYLCWQGVKAGLQVMWIHDVPEGSPPLHTTFKIGWRLIPLYSTFWDEQVDKDPLLQVISFATKLLYKHEDQT